MARAGESLTTLDRQSRKLDETMLVIADKERAVAIAGVMGGAASEVSASTTASCWKARGSNVTSPRHEQAPWPED